MSTLPIILFTFKYQLLLLVIGYFFRKNQNIKYTVFLLFILYSTFQIISITKVDTIPIILHAGGSVEGHDYYNTDTNIEEFYNNSTRLFEFDFMLSSDQEIILVHKFEEPFYPDWNNQTRVDKSTFDAFLILDQYQTLNLDELLLILLDYEDLNIVIDTKETDYINLYTKLIQEVMLFDESLLERMIPQLYSIAMYDQIEALYTFQEYHYTTYKYEDSLTDIVSFINSTSSINIVTFPKENLFHLLYLKNNVDNPLATHTINSTFIAKLYLYHGAEYIFTDKIK